MQLLYVNKSMTNAKWLRQDTWELLHHWPLGSAGHYATDPWGQQVTTYYHRLVFNPEYKYIAFHKKYQIKQLHLSKTGTLKPKAVECFMYVLKNSSKKT